MDSFIVSIFMKRIRLGQGFVVFILFFSIALLDAVHHFDWLGVTFWLAIGGVFVLADNMKNAEQKK